ncbi:hypothetical protein SAMN02746095_03963 [Acidocella aminolytica 101 = DSM 11237]|uniref:Uncharacterized protein n=1 Tax=Acidocella aminolytica 101 = DSM 11237 TaxID=1120923 RepID=A0A0D6PJA0_9PROT|nr:hypothetical protein Aam_115_004 [Acidocella aminolytica 101 = DSM 11237]GBQ38945.1 hypothetical protein AA11237_1927 [Acidocella aminolytica 101 = DSM 11237]SHF64983.1 hypothetical protein SAMN02746095_03963 [Acidocella aminolytica 101 = DSM 11237]
MTQLIYGVGLLAIPALLYLGVATRQEKTKPALVIPAMLWILLDAYLAYRLAFPSVDPGQTGCSILAYSCPPPPSELGDFMTKAHHIFDLVLLLVPVGIVSFVGTHFGAKRRF